MAQGNSDIGRTEGAVGREVVDGSVVNRDTTRVVDLGVGVEIITLDETLQGTSCPGIRKMGDAEDLLIGESIYLYINVAIEVPD